MSALELSLIRFTALKVSDDLYCITTRTFKENKKMIGNLTQLAKSTLLPDCIILGITRSTNHYKKVASDTE